MITIEKKKITKQQNKSLKNWKIKTIQSQLWKKNNKTHYQKIKEKSKQWMGKQSKQTWRRKHKIYKGFEK